jgi:transcriptional regulator with XRE-family HTH domain
MPKPKFDLAARLRQAREAAGLSQGQVAKLLGIHRPTLSEIEAGRRKVTAQELNEFANCYAVSLHWLANGESDPQANSPLLLAARELSKMSEKDLERLTSLLRMLRTESR